MDAFYISIPGFVISILLFINGKQRPALILLFLSSLFTFINAALLDHFVSMWDERFHALVAKNLMNHPLVPTLYDDPVLDMAYTSWDRYHIWLHKPPLFLLQIALSFRLFGVNELTLRLPSLIMASLLVLIIYRSGKLMGNSRVGFYAALLAGSSYYLHELVAGRKTLEHNDVAFIFYISASLWAWIEYLFNEKKSGKKWILLVGLFSGGAILSKWLPGLLVYLGWGMYILFQKELQRRQRLIEMKDFLLALMVTLLVALPWQIYSSLRFPEARALELKGYSNHLFIALDGHGGDFWYHFLQIGDLYGTLALYLIIPALVALLYFGRNRKLSVTFFMIILFVYLFYSLVKTKMPTFTFILILPVLIGFGFLMDYLFTWTKQLIKSTMLSRSLILVTLIGICWFNLNLKTLGENHDPDGLAAKMLMHNKAIFLGLKDKLPSNAVVFNVKGRHFIDCMFYSGFTAYGIIPTLQQVAEMKKKGRYLAVFDTGDLPSCLYHDPDVILIPELLQGWD